MLRIKIRYRGHLASLTGISEEEFEEPAFNAPHVNTPHPGARRGGSCRVDSILKMLGQRYGKKAEKEARAMLITINGENILQQKGYRTEIKDGDTVGFFPICAGG